MKRYEKGFSVAEILIIIVVIGLIGAAGWLVYNRQNSKPSGVHETSNTQTSTTQAKNASATETAQQFNATSFSLDVNKLPKDWVADTNTADAITLHSEGCFIEATKENDVALSASKQAEGIQSLLTINDKTGLKGYVVTDKGSSALTVYTNGSAQKVTSYEFSWDLPNNENPIRYSRSYSVQNGYYVSVKRSCNSETDFTKTDAAMSALIFR